jgi:hypothetical protein
MLEVPLNRLNHQRRQRDEFALAATLAPEELHNFVRQTLNVMGWC